MRLATVLTQESSSPFAAVAVDAKTWVALHDFLTFFGVSNLPLRLADLADFLPLLMPQFSELTRRVIDWPEHGRIFQQRGGRTLQPCHFLRADQAAAVRSRVFRVRATLPDVLRETRDGNALGVVRFAGLFIRQSHPDRPRKRSRTPAWDPMSWISNSSWALSLAGRPGM